MTGDPLRPGLQIPAFADMTPNGVVPANAGT
jgi:hypothetical protein